MTEITEEVDGKENGTHIIMESGPCIETFLPGVSLKVNCKGEVKIEISTNVCAECPH